MEARRRAAGERFVAGGDTYLLLDDVRSLWNVGSMFRTADVLGVCHFFLCGITGIPPHRDVHRTALGAEDAVSWSYHPHPFEALAAIPTAAVIALEQTPRSVPLEDLVAGAPRVLVVGHEEGGVSPEVLDRAAACVAIRCRGVKRSLNVAVACGIALYAFQETSRGLR